jgi:hypothetical protein
MNCTFLKRPSPPLTQLPIEIQMVLDDYFLALERLRRGAPIRVHKGARISNDVVALEAGRGKGSIKKSRGYFADLIESISRARTEQSESTTKGDQDFDVVKHERDEYRRFYEQSLSRELSLVSEIEELRRRLIGANNVLPIRTPE